MQKARRRYIAVSLVLTALLPFFLLVYAHVDLGENLIPWDHCEVLEQNPPKIQHGELPPSCAEFWQFELAFIFGVFIAATALLLLPLPVYWTGRWLRRRFS